MQEILQKTLENETMYYVIVPITLLILGWIKNWYDIKSKNKKMGYWKIQYRRGNSFYDIARKAYIYMMINLFIMQLLIVIISLWHKNGRLHIALGLIGIVINIIVTVVTLKHPKTKIELYTDGLNKQFLLMFLCIIFSTVFFVPLINYKNIALFVWGIALAGWVFLLFKYVDMIYILDKSCADIYVNGAESVKCIHAGSMRKNGGWIYVERYIGDYLEEIRIKESEIVRIDYYGEPLVTVQRLKIFRK